MSDTPLWEREFKPSNGWAVPAEVLALVAQEKLFDHSWHNDASPKFDTDGDGENKPGLSLYVGHPDAQHRMDNWDGQTHIPRYIVHSHNEDYELVSDDLLCTDDLNEALAYIEANRDDPLSAKPSQKASDLDGLILMLQQLRTTLPGNTPIRLYDPNEDINLGPPDVLQMFETTDGEAGGGDLWLDPEDAEVQADLADCVSDPGERAVPPPLVPVVALRLRSINE